MRRVTVKLPLTSSLSFAESLMWRLAVLDYLCRMEYPVFIYHELVVRLSEIEPSVGSYWDNSFEPGHCVIFTNKGSFKVDAETLEKQYRSPKLISMAEIQQLVLNFNWESSKQAFG